MKKPRFTLTELLVAVAIVATVACLALPAGTKISEKSRATRELSNLRQLGIATAAYLADHNDRIFSSATPGGWPSTLHSKYVSDWKPFKSPFDKRPDGPAASTGAGVPVSYGINVNILTQSASGRNAFEGDAAKYTSPSELIYMAPNVDLTQSTLIFIPGTGDTNVTLNMPTREPATKSDNRGTHAGRSEISVLYADFHCGPMSYRDFATASSSDVSARARWQPIHTP